MTSIFILSGVSAHAQDRSTALEYQRKSMQDAAGQTEDPDLDFDYDKYDTGETPPANTERNIFEEATDEQIAESQKFYKFCMKNKSMREKKDCKCAATNYLETRMNLGDEASVKDVMTEIRNDCLHDTARDVITGATVDTSDLTDEQLEEAQSVFNHCQNDQNLSRNYDCECFAAKFLDSRLEMGPIPQWEVIFSEHRNDCRNLVETTGYEYGRCMARFGRDLDSSIEPKDYCECYARKWADMFEAHKGNLTKGAKNNMKIKSRNYCKNPALYE